MRKKLEILLGHRSMYIQGKLQKRQPVQRVLKSSAEQIGAVLHFRMQCLTRRSRTQTSTFSGCSQGSTIHLCALVFSSFDEQRILFSSFAASKDSL